MSNNLATKMASSKEIDEQILPATCLEFLREIQYSSNIKQILQQLQGVARMQEEQSERLDELDGRIANMATYQTVIITLVSIMLLLMVSGGLVFKEELLQFKTLETQGLSDTSLRLAILPF